MKEGFSKNWPQTDYRKIRLGNAERSLGRVQRASETILCYHCVKFKMWCYKNKDKDTDWVPAQGYKDEPEFTLKKTEALGAFSVFI